MYACLLVSLCLSLPLSPSLSLSDLERTVPESVVACREGARAKGGGQQLHRLLHLPSGILKAKCFAILGVFPRGIPLCRLPVGPALYCCSERLMGIPVWFDLMGSSELGEWIGG